MSRIQRLLRQALDRTVGAHRRGDHDLRRRVAMLRGAFGRYVGEPVWIAFVSRLQAASPTFVELWAHHEVAEPDNRLKRVRAQSGEQLSLFTTSLGITGQPELRITVFTPTDAATRDYLSLRAIRAGLAGDARNEGHPEP